MKPKKEVWCKGCPIYENKNTFADYMKNNFGQSGNWDFEFCYDTCPKSDYRQHRLYAGHKLYGKARG